MARTKTIYLKKGEDETVKEAARFAAFHEGKTLGDLLVERCREILEKYKPNH